MGDADTIPPAVIAALPTQEEILAIERKRRAWRERLEKAGWVVREERQWGGGC